MTEAVATTKGRKLDARYTLLNKLGAGGQGEVWRAHDGTRGIDIALKILNPSLRNEAGWDALEHEYDIASRLDHASILKVFPPDRTGDVMVLPMELASGGDLRRLRGAGFLEIIPVLLEIAQALEHAHERGVIHRDLKPGNVLFDARGRARLADFGVAERAMTGVEAQGSLPPEAATRDTNRHGLSPFTASPAQLRGEPPTQADDIYGLGALAYELLSGYPPYYPHFDKKRAIEERVPELVPTRQIPPLLASLVPRMLAKDPKKRPRTMREVIDELDAALNDTLTFDFEHVPQSGRASPQAGASAASPPASAQPPGAAQSAPPASRPPAAPAGSPSATRMSVTGSVPLPAMFTSDEPAANMSDGPSKARDWSPTPGQDRRATSDRRAKRRDDPNATIFREPTISSDFSGTSAAATIAHANQTSGAAGAAAGSPPNSAAAPRTSAAAPAGPAATTPRTSAANTTSGPTASTQPAPAAKAPATPATAAPPDSPSRPGASALARIDAALERSAAQVASANETAPIPTSVQSPPIYPVSTLREITHWASSSPAAAHAAAAYSQAAPKSSASRTASPSTARSPAASRTAGRPVTTPAKTAPATSAYWPASPPKPRQPTAAPANAAPPTAGQPHAPPATAAPGYVHTIAAPIPPATASPATAPTAHVTASSAAPVYPTAIRATVTHPTWGEIPLDGLPRVARLEPIRTRRWPWVFLGLLAGAVAAVYFWLPHFDPQSVPPDVSALITPLQSALAPNPTPDAASKSSPVAAPTSAVSTEAAVAATGTVPNAVGAQTQTSGTASTAAASTTAASTQSPATSASLPVFTAGAEERLRLMRQTFDNRLAMLEARGAGVWGGRDFAMAKTRAAEAVGARDAGNPRMAQDRLAAASRLLDSVETKAPQAMTAQIAAGEKALGTGQQEVAGQAFDLARRIDPNDHRASDGQRRAQSLNGVLPLLADAQNAEAARDYARAAQDYSQALSLDPGNAAARAGQTRANAAFGDDSYAKAVGSGFAALGAGRLDEAHDTFVKARALKPNGAEASEGLRRVGAALTARGFASMRQRAVGLEAQERWDEAEQSYEAVLSADSSLAFAQEGKARTSSRAELAGRLQQLIDRPDRLAAPGVREEARSLLETAQAQSPSGPVLRSQIARLQILLPGFDRPVRLSLLSDNSTQVVISSIGSFGAFSRRDIELRPGKYVVVGTRNGFRDVRREITVAPGQDIQTIKVTCSEPI